MSQTIKDQRQNKKLSAGKRRRKQVTFFPGVMVRDFAPDGDKNDSYYNSNDYSGFVMSVGFTGALDRVEWESVT